MTRQDQIDAYIAALLQTITQQNSYNTNAGQNVYKDQQYTEHPDVMPAIAWFPGSLDSGCEIGPAPADMGSMNHMYSLSWEGCIADDLDGGQGGLLRADLVRALYSDPHFGGLIELVDSCKSVAAVQNGDDIFSLVQVSFTAFYTTPYGQE